MKGKSRYRLTPKECIAAGAKQAIRQPPKKKKKKGTPLPHSDELDAGDVLAVENLNIAFMQDQQKIAAVRNLSFSLQRGETLAIVGESGSGKSVTALALMRLLEQAGGLVQCDQMLLRRRSREVIELSEQSAAQMRHVRGADMAMIFQEPMTSLNPVFTVGEQIAESIRLHQNASREEAMVEAKRMLDSIDRRSVPRDMLATYYKAYNRFYQQYVAFSGQRHFRELEERYQDSVIMFADTVSVRYKLDRLYQMSRRKQSHEMEVRLLGYLNSLEPDSQLYAECAYSVGSFYRRRGDDWLARKYYMLSAMTDIRNSTKENAAFQALATLYYRHGDLFRAFRYTQAAVEDALFSNVQCRTVQMSELYSIIIASHQAKESRTKHKLQYYLVLISVLSAVLVLLFVYLYKQLRRVYRIKEELSQTNAKLARLNEELGEKNEQLSDSNAVKVQYIARFFDLCSMYIDKMDDYRKSLKKLAQDRKFDELNRRLKSTSMLEDEQDELYKNFDAIFLNLYPSFVEDFNALLTEDERIVLKQEDLLNKELRIYALLRLGITDSVKIASFLRCSLSPVYNYRTKVRNKAAISREEFEKMVMKIGTAHKTDV